jgi:hypothetical protein
MILKLVSNYIDNSIRLPLLIKFIFAAEVIVSSSDKG